MLDKFAVARALREIALLLELKEENPFKVRAYEMGAQALENVGEDLQKLVLEERLTSVRGIGDALSAKIAELHRTGSCALLDELRRDLPAGIAELVRVPDLGPKKIIALHRALGVATLADLKAACEAGMVRSVKGFGEKTERKILDGIARLERREAGVTLDQALEIGGGLLAHLRASDSVERAEPAGSARRRKETVADLDLVVASSAPEAVMERLVAFPLVADVIARGDTKSSVRLGSGLQVDLRVVPAEDFATALHHCTGSKAHHVKLRGLARSRGLSLSEWGLVSIEDGAKMRLRSEDELYAALGLPYVPPELREDEGEIEAALAGTLPADLVEVGDVRGLVHCHTVYSDGKNTIEEMARAADAIGIEYLTITDHSPTASYAGGVELDRLRRQWDEIARVQEGVRVRLLRGTESDILEDGALDYPDEVLEKMEVVIASVHSRMKMGAERMTERLVRAMRQPIFKVWGHPLGRILQRRLPFACDVERVLDVIAESRAAIEINGDPRRLDMEPRWVRAARRRGIRFVISTDAHSVRGLSNLSFGVATARRGWVRRGEVLNALPADEFARAVRPAG